jgi:hypothetical protein
MKLGVTANAQHSRIEERSILPIADVVQLERSFRLALLAAKAGADKRGMPNS